MDIYSETSDAELVRLSLADKEVFACIIDRYQQKIHRYVRRISSFSDDVVQDILQNTFIKAYINLNSFDTNLQFSSWIYRIAHNETISFLRKNKKHLDSTLFTDDSMDDFVADINIEKEYASVQDTEVLMNAIKNLKEEYQNIIILKYFEHKSYDEISDIIQKPPGTVATWINRAKRDIQKILKKQNYTHHE